MRTFNCGIGAVLIVDKMESHLVLKHLEKVGEEASVIGVVELNKGDAATWVKLQSFSNVFESKCLVYMNGNCHE